MKWRWKIFVVSTFKLVRRLFQNESLVIMMIWWVKFYDKITLNDTLKTQIFFFFFPLWFFLLNGLQQTCLNRELGISVLIWNRWTLEERLQKTETAVTAFTAKRASSPSMPNASLSVVAACELARCNARDRFYKLITPTVFIFPIQNFACILKKLQQKFRNRKIEKKLVPIKKKIQLFIKMYYIAITKKTTKCVP